jgi:hypothetical protein
VRKRQHTTRQCLLVAEQLAAAATVDSVARASEVVVPVVRATHSAPSVQPRSRWALHSTARAAARAEAAAHAFAVAASSSASDAQSAPDQRSASKAAASSRS